MSEVPLYTGFDTGYDDNETGGYCDVSLGGPGSATDPGSS